MSFSAACGNRPHIKAAVPEVEERACSIEQRGNHPLPHVEALISRVLNSVHEYVAFLRVPVEVDVQQHLRHNTDRLIKSEHITTGDGGNPSSVMACS